MVTLALERDIIGLRDTIKPAEGEPGVRHSAPSAARQLVAPRDQR